ncbi:PhzF family phenazine biosynthesis protein [Seongchinamella unica]|uniref:PhzF family phenazine biosynthesis protein n=1 Tax=Seongchinamella unica TaxID=2547392 RepID=A0A4R5LST9_9GAMM|nr:PhzF family phenazine biosynthesis protein [Seongchinamella unica]TDG13916.1 PhzF family phenazine biosynthesis protein [Seongchinamella unica]
MNLRIFQVDAFTRKTFGGNPAAVMPLKAWLEDALLQAIALENNLSETAFLVPREEDFELRWFTPEVEVDLCGHATLASAHVLYQHLGYTAGQIRFHTRAGELRVSRAVEGYTLDFPGYRLDPGVVDIAVSDALGLTASEVVNVHGAAKQLHVFEFEEDVSTLEPDFAALKTTTDKCIIATAPGNGCDFVSRFFGPQVGINEDPVTGSAHCALVPYWAERLGQNALSARQISARGGELECRYGDGRVSMTGQAVTFMQGEVFLPD